MGITKVDDIPSEIANDDYGMGDALISEVSQYLSSPELDTSQAAWELEWLKVTLHFRLLYLSHR